MSLIILKNTDSQAPNRFGNDFVNTITINKNSEVALHSISFNRLDGYAVNDFFFYIYHGPQLDIDSEVIDDIWCAPTSIYTALSRHTGGNGSYRRGQGHYHPSRTRSLSRRLHHHSRD